MLAFIRPITSKHNKNNDNETLLCHLVEGYRFRHIKMYIEEYMYTKEKCKCISSENWIEVNQTCKLTYN